MLKTLLLILVSVGAAFGPSRLCPITEEAGSRVWYRPPGLLFAVVWSVLMVLFGLAWSRSAKGPGMHLAFLCALLLICSWTVLYGCVGDKRWGVYIIAASIAAVAGLMVVSDARLLLVPLLGWLNLALHMATTAP